jgi:hypothetical protein
MCLRVVGMSPFLSLQNEAPVRVSVLNLVDLAGSENSKMADTKGQRLQEARYINQSLLTLSTCSRSLKTCHRCRFTVLMIFACPARHGHLPVE